MKPLHEFRSVFGAALWTVLCVASACPESAWGQDAAQAGEGGEIVVTARRIEERLQDVPASISVLNSAAADRS